MSAATARNQANPFTPMFGKVPAYMAGRELLIDEMVQAFELPDSNPNLCSIFVGARGTGKTALLTYLGYRAQQEGWIVADTTASHGMLDDILQRIGDAASHLLTADCPGKLTGIGVASIASVSWENNVASGNWRTKMNAIFSQLEKTQTGIVITVDEIDGDLPEVVELVTTYQHFVREGKKVALLMAGLPYKVSALLSGKSTSFLRRAARHDLGAIPDYEVYEAFRLTIEDAGKAIDDDALDLACEAIGGFPFMFQLVGYRSWNASRQAKTITAGHVQNGIQVARMEFEDRVLSATFSELSKGDMTFLSAMNSEGQTPRDEIAKRTGKKSGWMSTYKKRLLEAGVIDEPVAGKFVFALPGAAKYLQEKR